MSSAVSWIRSAKCQANAVQPANYSKLWGHVQQSYGLRKLSWYVAQEVGRSWRIAGWTVQCVIRPVCSMMLDTMEPCREDTCIPVRQSWTWSCVKLLASEDMATVRCKLKIAFVFLFYWSEPLINHFYYVFPFLYVKVTRFLPEFWQVWQRTWSWQVLTSWNCWAGTRRPAADTAAVSACARQSCRECSAS